MTIDSDEIALILSGVKILQNLEVEIVNDIAHNTEIAEFNQGDTVVKAGEVGERIYFVYKGKLEVQIADTLGEIKRRILVKKGEVVGEISLLVESTYSADIVALTEANAFYLDRARFKLLIERHPDLAEVMSQLMTSRMAHYGGINRVGKYELRGKLGEGNMATVFNA
jgi:CRP-like cAMP-binding protein